MKIGFWDLARWAMPWRGGCSMLGMSITVVQSHGKQGRRPGHPGARSRQRRLCREGR